MHRLSCYLSTNTTISTIKKMHSKLVENPQSAVVVLGFDAKDPGHYGRLVIDHEGHLQKITEFLDCSKVEKQITLCNSGIMLVRGKYIKTT